MSFFEELRRRNVFRAGIAYVIVAWLVLQVADVVLPNIQAPEWIFQVILLLLLIAFPVVLVLAWAFELTPEGLKRETEVDRSEPQSAVPMPRRQVDFAIIGLLAVALAYLVFDKFVLSPDREAERIETVRQAAISEAATDKSIAVLPFVNLSSDTEQEYFADGLSEELLNLLAKIPALRVIARTSSFSYRGENVNIADIARELDVNHILEGSVKKSSDAVEVTARLIRAADSSTLWSGDFPGTLDDIFRVQDDIAKAVVEQLRPTLLGAVPTTERTDPEAYALYLQARELARQSTKEGHEQALALYRDARKIAPGYAAAWAGQAESYIFLAERVLRPLEETFGLARDAANAALQHDPNHAPAHASLGRIAMVHDHDLAQAARHLERALELDPGNPQILRQAAILSANLNRIEEAIGLLEHAAARDPVSAAVHANLGLNYYSAGRLDEAIAAFRTALSLSRDAIGYHSWLGGVLLAKNQPAPALEEMREEPSEPWRLLGLVMAHHALEQPSESDRNLATLTDKYGNEWPFNIAYVLAYRGDTDLAFDWLQQAQERNDPGLSEIVSTPEFDNIRSDPRWLLFLKSIGKAPQQLDDVAFTVTRPN